MKVALFGANGFIGQEVRKTLTPQHEVVGAGRGDNLSDADHAVDLTDQASIKIFLEATRPDVIINCAGIVDATQDVSLNGVFTRNILEAVATSKLPVNRIIILGSAGEYGQVKPDELPVNEDTPLSASAGYGLSKVQEETTALALADEHNISVIVARLFNPVGAGMHPRMLVSGVLRQIQEVKDGTREAIEVGRLDGTRDFIAIHDVALAIKALAEHKDLKNRVYNVGSGQRTTIQHLVELLVQASGLQPVPELKETMQEPEPLFAVQADVSRIQADTGWQPQTTLEDVVKDIVNAK